MRVCCCCWASSQSRPNTSGSVAVASPAATMLRKTGSNRGPSASRAAERLSPSSTRSRRRATISRTLGFELCSSAACSAGTSGAPDSSSIFICRVRRIRSRVVILEARPGRAAAPDERSAAVRSSRRSTISPFSRSALAAPVRSPASIWSATVFPSGRMAS